MRINLHLDSDEVNISSFVYTQIGLFVMWNVSVASEWER
jgi:hypothetical protein